MDKQYEWVEWISTPKQPKPFILKEEPHPLSLGRTVFRAYTQDGQEVHVAGETLEEAEQRLRGYEMVSEITVVYLEK